MQGWDEPVAEERWGTCKVTTGRTWTPKCNTLVFVWIPYITVKILK